MKWLEFCDKIDALSLSLEQLVAAIVLLTLVFLVFSFLTKTKKIKLFDEN